MDETTELTDDTIFGETDENIIDSLSGEAVDFESAERSNSDDIPVIIDGGNIIAEPQNKIYVVGVSVTLLSERIQHLDSDGKLMTESLRNR